MGKSFAGVLSDDWLSSEPHVFPPCIHMHVPLYSVALFGNPFGNHGCESSFLAIFTPTQRHSMRLSKRQKIAGMWLRVSAMLSGTAPIPTKSPTRFADSVPARSGEITIRPQPI